MEKLSQSFYQSTDVVKVARLLLGKLLYTNIDGNACVGRIVETEAYNGTVDRASHAFNGRFTARTQTMYLQGGVAYVYRCYGLHQMFNVVCGPAGQPLAVLIRALKPVQGVAAMQARRSGLVDTSALCRGPGNLAKAMGIGPLQNSQSLASSGLQLLSDGVDFDDTVVNCGPRIGVQYAGSDANLPYRFFVKHEPAVSGPKG